MNNNVRTRRIFAWILDWNLSGLIPLIFSKVFFGPNPSIENPILVLIFLLLILLFPTSFVLRDVIFCGRSIGRRIFGLYIIDKKTDAPATVKQRIARNLFFFIYPFDGLLLLLTKETIGDRVADTFVVKK